MNTIQKQPTEDIIYSKTQTIAESFQDRALIESSITNLLTEEAEVEVSKEQQEIAMYAQRIISTIEDLLVQRLIPMVNQQFCLLLLILSTLFRGWIANNLMRG